MATASLASESMGWWAPVTNLYAVSEPFNGADYVAVTVAAVGTEVFPSTGTGASIPDPNGFGHIAHRKWYPPIDHEQALTELGYEVSGAAD